MKCKICKRNNIKYVKIQKGTICPDCYESLAPHIRECANQFTAKQLQNMRKIAKYTDYTKEASKYWGFVGADRTPKKTFFVSDKSILYNDTEILYSDISKISLQFHPTQKHGKDYAKGWLAVHVTTRKPKVEFQFIISRKDFYYDGRDTIKYSIHGRDITYFYKDIDLVVINGISNLINGSIYNLEDVKQRYYDIAYETHDYQCDYSYEEIKKRDKIRNEKEQKKREKQEAERKRQEKIKKDREERARFENWRSWQEKGKNQKIVRPITDFDRAKKLFDIEIPYTERELKEKRNDLIKKTHPDAGGSTEDAAVINQYYALLKKFAVEEKR